jgi:hypothetical protein
MFSAMNNNGTSGGQSVNGGGGGSTAPSPMLHGLDASMSVSYTGGSTTGNNVMDALVNAAAAGAPPAMVQVVEGRESVLEDDPGSNLDGNSDMAAAAAAAGSGSSSSSGGGGGSSGLTRSNSRPLLSGLEGEEETEEPFDSALPAAAASTPLGGNSNNTDTATFTNPSPTTTTGSSSSSTAEAFRDTQGHESGAARASTRAEELGDGVGREVDETDDTRLGPVPATSKARDIANKATKGAADGYARCRACGDLINRDVVSIEAHERVCRGNPRSDNSSNKGDKDAKAAPASSSSSSSVASSPSGGGFFSGIKSVLGWSSSSRTADGNEGYTTGGVGVPRSPKGSPKASAKYPPGSPKQDTGGSGLALDTTNTTGGPPGESPRFAKLEKKFSFHTGSGGTPRPGAKDLSKSPARIIYRTARAHQSALFNFRPREVCALQDAFVDKDGSCYVYVFCYYSSFFSCFVMSPSLSHPSVVAFCII